MSNYVFGIVVVVLLRFKKSKQILIIRHFNNSVSHSCKFHHSRIEFLQNYSVFLSAMSLHCISKDLNFLSYLLLYSDKILKKKNPQNLDKQINSFHIQNTLADFNNVNNEFFPKDSSQKNPPKKSSQKILPKKSSQKIYPKKFFQKNPPKKISTKYPKNTKRFQIPKLKISNRT